MKEFDSTGKKFYAIIIEINKWFDYYCKNHVHPQNDTEIAIDIFDELSKIFTDYIKLRDPEEKKQRRR